MKTCLLLLIMNFSHQPNITSSRAGTGSVKYIAEPGQNLDYLFIIII